MRLSDRVAAILLLVAAVFAWAAVGLVATTIYPDALEVRLGMAAAVGLAVALTVAPLAWLASVARAGRSWRAGAWTRALRRGGLTGGVAALAVALQVTGSSSLPIVTFAALLAGFVEVTLTYRR